MCRLYKCASSDFDLPVSEQSSRPGLASEGVRNRGSLSISVTKVEISKLRPLEHRMDWPESVAKNICQSVEYCMQDQMLALGPGSVAPPLMIVAENLKSVC